MKYRIVAIVHDPIQVPTVGDAPFIESYDDNIFVTEVDVIYEEPK